MAETAVTSNLGWDNFFSTTTTGALTATTTTIPLATPPTPTEGFLVLDPGGANEIIFYNSVSGNNVIVPSADDRGRGDSTAQAHSSGITVKMNTVGMMFEALQSGLALTDSAITTAKIANNAVTPAKRTGGFAVGVFTITGTGNVSVTGLGFTPKMVEFVYLTTIVSNARDGLGVMTATSQYSLSVSTSSSGNSVTNADTSTCIRCDSGGGTTFIVASYTSMDADGFTINVTTLASGPHVIGYKAFA